MMNDLSGMTSEASEKFGISMSQTKAIERAASSSMFSAHHRQKTKSKVDEPDIRETCQALSYGRWSLETKLRKPGTGNTTLKRNYCSHIWSRKAIFRQVHIDGQRLQPFEQPHRQVREAFSSLPNFRTSLTPCRGITSKFGTQGESLDE